MRRSAFVRTLILLLLTALPSEGAPQVVGVSAEMPTMMPPGRKAKIGTGRLRGRVASRNTRHLP